MPHLEGTDDGVGFGVHGVATTGVGVKGEGTGGDGVVGTTKGIHKAGIRGIHTGHISAIAVIGELQRGTSAIYGITGGGSGIAGDEVIGSGVWGDSSLGPGLSATSRDVGVFAQGSRLAGQFIGDIEVSGDIRLMNADFAEEFTCVGGDDAGAGTVMVLTGEGSVVPSTLAYDRRVAGVVSGAGDYKPAIILDRHPIDSMRKALALAGKVFCKVDATYGEVEIGDLLTTSATPGHAMKASDSRQAFGAVIGKALRPIREGRGLIPMLVALQ